MDGPILAIDRDTARPIGQQLVDGLRRGILGGALRPGDPVPSTRSLAAELGVSRSAVVGAYEQLAGEGYLEMRQGAPTRVAAIVRPTAAAAEPPAHGALGRSAGSPAAPRVTRNGRGEAAHATTTRDSTPSAPRVTRNGRGGSTHATTSRDSMPAGATSSAPGSVAAPESLPARTSNAGRIDRPADAARHPRVDALAPRSSVTARIDLMPGRPSTARIDVRAWRAAWRHAAALDVPDDVPPAFGVRHLREQIADHLRHARGVACEADDVVVTAGTSDAVALVASALVELTGSRRHPTVAVEHPGYPSARRTLERRGVRTAPVQVDSDGLVVESLRRMPQPPDAVLVTPSHQYPLGGRLPVATRLELLDWAAATGAIVIEDDYDSEFRHLGPPLPALASLDDAARVVLVGSFSKVLTPWLRLGYLVLPSHPSNPELRDVLVRIRHDEPCAVAGTVQDAAAALLASGAVRRHIASTRRDYAHRRRLVLAALDGIPGAPLSGLDGGLHAVVRLPGPAASAAVEARLAAEGVAVAALGAYSAVAGEEQPGIVFGYAPLGDTLLAEGLARIRASVLAVV